MWKWRNLFALLTVCISITSASASHVADDPVTLESELSTRNVRSEESDLADIIVDAIRDLDKSDAALMHASAFVETNIPRGPSTVEALLKAVQYREDLVVVVNLTGEQIRKALENGCKLLPQRSAEFLQVSGIKLSVDPSPGKDKRTSDIRIGRTTIQDSRKYSVAMPAPLANGALGYYKIWDKATALDHETNSTVAQAVKTYLKSKKSVSGITEERIAIKR